MNTQALQILLLLQLTHWIADYTHLSTDWMLSAKRFGKPLAPIFTHALIHTVLVQIVLLIFVKGFILVLELMGLQLFTHFGIDVLKGKMNTWFPEVQSQANRYHWYLFGFDQLLHQVVLILITYYAT